MRYGSIKMQKEKKKNTNPDLNFGTAVCHGSSFLLTGCGARAGGRCSSRQDGSSPALIESHHAGRRRAEGVALCLIL